MERQATDGIRAVDDGRCKRFMIDNAIKEVCKLAADVVVVYRKRDFLNLIPMFAAIFI